MINGYVVYIYIYTYHDGVISDYHVISYIYISYVKHMAILLYPLVTILGVMVSSPFLKDVCLEVDCLKSSKIKF